MRSKSYMAKILTDVKVEVIRHEDGNGYCVDTYLHARPQLSADFDWLYHIGRTVKTEKEVKAFLKEIGVKNKVARLKKSVKIKNRRAEK